MKSTTWTHNCLLWMVPWAVLLSCTGEGWVAAAKEPVSAPASRPAYQNALLCEVYGEISDVTLTALEHNFAAAQKMGADVVILKIDTYGGALTSALEMSQLIKRQSSPVVAWVNPKALSAGALLALACNKIVIAPHGMIGDCAPIVPGQTLEGVEREKGESPTRAEFRDSARRAGYNVPLAMAMVTGSDGFYLVARKDDPTVKKIVSPEEMRQLTGEEAESWSGPTSVPADEAGQWKLVKEVLAPKQLLTMHDDEAVEYGFAQAVVGDESQLRQALNVTGKITHVAPSWLETLAVWLGGSAVRGVLMGLFMLSIWIAFQTPGHGLPEVAAIVFLALVLIPPYLTGLANWVEIAMIVVGLILIAVEIFILPGFGVAGVTGIFLLLVGLVMTFVPLEPGRGMFSWPQMQQTWDHLINGTLIVLSSTLAAFFVGLVFMYYFPRTTISRLAIPLNPTADGTLTTAAGVLGSRVMEEARVGDSGAADTDLRPSGKARVNGKLLDVVAVGQYIPAGAKVRVVRVEPNRIVVEPIG